MRNSLAAATAIAALVAITAPASAAINLDTSTSGTPLTETLQVNPGVDGNLVTFLSTPSNLAIDFTSPDMLHSSSTGGFAFIEGTGVKFGDGFSALTIMPETITFTSFKFNLMLPAPNGPDFTSKTDFTFDLEVDYNGGSSKLFTGVSGDQNGENRMLIFGDANEAINKIIFSNLKGVTGSGDPVSYNFDSLRQMSFNYTGGAVPEPSTWAMFILGFGFIGTMLRSARARQPASAA
jgi:hypothetical protein